MLYYFVDNGAPPLCVCNGNGWRIRIFTGGVFVSCDLHCHTKLSDGSVGIEELISLAKRRGLSAIAITDHDTFAGAVRGVNIGKRLGLTVIPGAELSTMDTKTGRKVHILCYNCEAVARLEGICHRMLEGRKKTTTEMLKKVMRYYPLAPEMVVRCATGSTSVYKQHIMHALMEAGYADSMYGDVFNRLFGAEKGVARVENTYPDVREVLELVHSAGGIAVLAHPYLYDNIDLMKELTAEGLLDGVEVAHHSHTEEQEAELRAFAKANKLLITGGSDFHGMYGRGARAVASTSVEDDALAALLAYKKG